MTRVKLADSDKAAIRDLTEEAIASGADESGLAELRRTLAESSGASARSLGSVSAYVRYSATQALTESGLEGRVTREQLVHAARLLRDSPRVLHDADLLAAGWGETAREAKQRAVSLLTGDFQTDVEQRLHRLSYSESKFNTGDSLHELRVGVGRALIAQCVGSERGAMNRTLLEDAVRTVWAGITEEDIGRNSDRELRAGIESSFDSGRLWLPQSLGHFWRVMGQAYRGRIFGGCEPLHLGLALWHSTFGVSYFRGDHLLYDYMSETKPGGARSPFFTTAAHMMRPDAVAGRHQGALEWCAALLREYNRPAAPTRSDHMTGGVCRVIDRAGRPRVVGETAQWNDRVQVMAGHHAVAEITFGALREAMLAITSAKRQYDLSL
jgi:hypothetical protein